MITGEIKSKVDSIWNAMWAGGIANSLTVIEQLTYLLFIKRLDNQQPDEAGTDKVRKAVADLLLNQVQAMPKENFLVRMQLEAVGRFEKNESWESIRDEDVAISNQQIAGLPDSLPTEKLEAKRFDLICLRLQLAQLEGNAGAFEKLRKKVIGIAEVLEGKPNIPVIQEQLSFIQLIQQIEFWENVIEGVFEAPEKAKVNI